MQPVRSLNKSQLKFVLFEGIHPSAVETLYRDGYTQVESYTQVLGGQALIDAIGDANFIGLRSRTQLTEEVLNQATKLAAVGCFCIGTNQVDLLAAAKRGIPVFNAPFSSTRSVAELVIGEIVMLMRGIPEKNFSLHRGEWVKSASHSFEVRGKTLGIIGYGHIGTQIGILAEQLGMSVVFYDTEDKLVLGNARQMRVLDELLRVSNVVTLHVPDAPSTRHMIGAAELSLMRHGSYLINASRGAAVEIDALVAALESKHLQGAAIDVFPAEPKENNASFMSPLLRFENVLLTPHIGGSTSEAQAGIGFEVATKLIRYSNNGSTTSAVNFPEVSLPEFIGKCRLLHIHQNIPGVLARINECFAKGGVNIAAQYLQTTELVGYVVIDVDTTAGNIPLENLNSIEGTICCRIIN